MEVNNLTRYARYPTGPAQAKDLRLHWGRGGEAPQTLHLISLSSFIRPAATLIDVKRVEHYAGGRKKQSGIQHLKSNHRKERKGNRE